MGSQGNERYLKPINPKDLSDTTWKELFKDFEWDVEVEITPENTDKEATLTTLSTILQTVVSNPAIFDNPTAKMLFNKILEETGRFSPVEINSLPQVTQPTQPTQQIPTM
jgi:hypothetical protein